jgi:putative spermidine/putrescine transport system substrate-binding protein
MEKFSRRDIMQLFGLTTASIALVEAGWLTPANAARAFTWASTGGSWGEHLDDIFVNKGGFAKATSLTPDHSFQLESIAASKIVAANGTPPYDVSDHGEAEVVMLKEAGLLLPYKTDLMPNYADIYDVSRMDDVYASTSLLMFGLVWNQKEIKEAPSGYEALLKPDYKGRVGIPAYGWYGMYWLHGLNKHLGGDEDNISPGMQFAADMVKKNKATIVENADHGKKLMEQGEIIINPYWNGIASQMQRDGVPTKFEAVPGCLVLGTGFVILKGTPYEQAANRFVNLSLDPQLQVEFASWNLYPPSNRKAVMPAEFDNIKIKEEELSHAAKLNWSKVVAHKAEYLNRWNQEVLG